MRLPEALRSQRSRDFRAFFGAQTIPQNGTYMLSVAEGWLVLPLVLRETALTTKEASP